MLTKDEIAQRQESTRYEVRRVTLLDGEIRVRKLSAAEVIRNQNAKGADAILMAASVVDEAGAPLFTVTECQSLNADVFAEIGRIISDVNGWGKDPGDVEKN